MLFIRINTHHIRTFFVGIFMATMLAITLFIPHVYAGVALGTTRVIYPSDQRQVQLAVTNSEENSVYLIQSWLENSDGKKDTRFVITPPLFTMKGKKENTLRIIDATNNTLPQDRESLFWINVKAIPSSNKEKKNENTLQLAITSRIKFYYRPAGLTLKPEMAAEKLRFIRQGEMLRLINPTPYFLTVTEINAGTRILENTLVPPMGESSVKIPADAGTSITYKTINDYGAVTPKMTGIMQ